MGMTPKPLADRVRALTKMLPGEDACWEWAGKIARNGYGHLTIWVGPRKTTQGAHRVSWRLAHGDVPPGRYVLHRCDNRRCVRPTHLFLGTARDNARDAMAKCRFTTGERHGRTQLTDADVRDIRAAKGIVGRRELAARYGVRPESINRIQRGASRALGTPELALAGVGS